MKTYRVEIHSWPLGVIVRFVAALSPDAAVRDSIDWAESMGLDVSVAGIR